MLPLAASAQSLVQRCAGYAGRIEALCSRVPTSCPGVNDHPCLAGRGTASYEQYLAVCLAGRVGEPEFQRDLGTAQALVDNCRPGITPLPPVTPAPQRPCPSELVANHQRLQDEAAQLRAEIDLQRRQPINPGPDLARRAAAAQSAVTEAASLLDMVGPVPELGGMAGELKQARVLTEEVAARAPTSAEALLRMLEERQRVVGHQIFAVRERAESQGCVLPVPRSLAPATATAPRRVAVTPSGAVLAREDTSDYRAAEAIGWVTAFAKLAQEDAEDRELRARRLKFRNDSGATTIDTGRSTQGSEVTTPEGKVRSERTLYVVARDASRQATFVYVREGQVSATPLRGTALRVSAGQGALLTATGLRLLTVATAVGPAMEDNTDRRGADYANLDLPAAQPQLCRERCEGDANCRAWTYVKPGVQGANARCWLKNAAPAPLANNCCVSGVITTATPTMPPTQPVRLPNGDIRYDRPAIEGVAVDHCASWATNCGQGGADAFCRHHGHPRAVSFRVHNPARTWVLADQRVCAGGNCVGFSEVVCAGQAVAPPPPPQPPSPPSPPPITQLTCWDWSGQMKNGALVRSKVEMSPNGALHSPAWGMRGTIRNIGGNRYQVAWNGRPPGQEDNLVMDASGVLSGSNFETNWIRAERTACDGSTVAPPPPPMPPVQAGDCWGNSRGFIEINQNGWIGTYTRRGTSNVFDVEYMRAGTTSRGELTLELRGRDEILINRYRTEGTNWTAQIGATIDTSRQQATGAYPGGDRFSLACSSGSSAGYRVAPIVPTPPSPGQAAELGTVWNEVEETEQAVWTRRPSSNTFDASWSNGRVRAVLEMSVQGHQVTIRRSQSTDGYECLYTGTISGNQVSGSFGCNRFSGQKPWRATIQGQGQGRRP